MSFITFEGGEGSGKSTQLEKLSRALKAQGLDVLQTREPGGTEIGQLIRRTLLTGESQSIHPLTELLLYSADRTQHVRQVIRPALEQGKTVLCDRYQDSTLVYQGYGRGLDLGTINILGQWATDDLMPQWTMLLDCPADVGLARSKARLEAQNSGEDRFEKEALDFHERCRKGFLDLAKNNPERFLIVDATQDPEKVHTEILQFLEEKIL